MAISADVVARGTILRDDEAKLWCFYGVSSGDCDIVGSHVLCHSGSEELLDVGRRPWLSADVHLGAPFPNEAVWCCSNCTETAQRHQARHDPSIPSNADTAVAYKEAQLQRWELLDADDVQRNRHPVVDGCSLAVPLRTEIG